MIEGITILNEIPVYTPAMIQYALFIALFVCSIVVRVVAFIDYTDDTFITFCVLGVICIISLISLIIIKPVFNYTKYEVTINDNISYTEFNDKYEVIEQRGAIYTIKERN